MTEEQQGGPTPEPEAIASAADQASEETVAAVAVADEPATSTDDAEHRPPNAETPPQPTRPRRQPEPAEARAEAPDEAGRRGTARADAAEVAATAASRRPTERPAPRPSSERQATR